MSPRIKRHVVFKEKIVENPSFLENCEITSVDISNMYPSLPTAMIIKVSHVDIDEVYLRATLSLGSKLIHEHIPEKPR